MASDLRLGLGGIRTGDMQEDARHAGVDSVITTAELGRRPARAPDFQSENQALLKLATTMAQAPHRVLQELVVSAFELCRAGSAGISLLEPEQNGRPAQFRWVATAGEFDRLLGNTMPRDSSPCGTVLDRNRMLLMGEASRFFRSMAELPLPVREVLLVPFYRGAEPIGTVWIAAHTVEHRFDLEDARLVTSLSQFAAAAVQVLQTGDINRQSQEAIRRELKDTRLLRDVAARLIGSGELDALFAAILDAAIAITQADAGTIQLLDPASGSLTFLATRGFDSTMYAHFASVDASSGSPCGLALSRGERVCVLFDDPEVLDLDGALKMHLDAGMRCAQSTPLLSRAGQPLGMFSTHWRERREFTERELRFLDLLGRQAADLIERTQVLDALRVSDRQLRDADRRKDEFLAVLAHELRNPLVPIRNGIELLKRVRESPLVDQLRPMMERQIEHVVHLIDDLLDVSRISSGKIELQRKLVTVSGLVESAVEANRSAIAAAALDLRLELDPEDSVVEVDPTRVSQVIANVLHNATKFTAPGGKITLRTEYEMREHNSPRELILKITDTGIGIPRESLPKIFGLFSQAHADSTARQGGLGIGLALAQKLIELHGGSIEADSGGPGLGSEFTLRIPAPAIHASTDLPRTPATDNLNGVRVLVVDDNQDAADSMGLLIADLGAEVRVAYDGTNAISVVRTFDPSLVLLDIGMPDLDGYEACQTIRREKGAAISIVAVTGWGQEADRRRTAEAGFDAHLTKPVEPAQLAALIGRTSVSSSTTP
jgi:signal transduction histidine kinase/ActR/RegA family two-component response regulator